MHCVQRDGITSAVFLREGRSFLPLFQLMVMQHHVSGLPLAEGLSTAAGVIKVTNESGLLEPLTCVG